MNDHIPDVTKMINQWTNGTEILNVKPNGDFELGNGVDPLVALGQLAKAFMQQQDRIKRLEEQLMDAKNKHAVLIADVVLNEDRAEQIKRLRKANFQLREGAEEQKQRIQRLEDAGDYLCAAAAFMGWHDKIEAWNKAKEAK